MSGRLIGPKTWDRIIGILEARLDSPWTVWAACVVIYALNQGFGVYEAENGHGIGLHKVEPMCGEWAVRVCFETVKTVPVCGNWTKNVHVLCA